MGQILLDSGRIRVEDAERILRLQKEQGLRFGEAAIQLGLLAGADIDQALACQFDYPYLAPGEGGYSQDLAAAYAPFSPKVEALRALRSQLTLRWFAPDRKLLAVVGAANGAGASYTAANLAVVFSQLGERTLLIDADLRTPRQQHLFRLVNRRGLSDMLAGRTAMDQVEKIQGFLDLSVLGSGTIPPNPQELLSRTAFADLLLEYTARFDVILIDAPPVSVAADVQTIAARAGGVLMVVRPGHTRMADAVRFKKMVIGASAELVGTVLNDY